MQDFHNVFQQLFRMKRRFFIIGHFVCVASVDVLLLESLEAGVGGIVFFQFAIGLVCILIVFASILRLLSK